MDTVTDGKVGLPCLLNPWQWRENSLRKPSSARCFNMRRRLPLCWMNGRWRRLLPCRISLRIAAGNIWCNIPPLCHILYIEESDFFEKWQERAGLFYEATDRLYTVLDGSGHSCRPAAAQRCHAVDPDDTFFHYRIWVIRMLNAGTKKGRSINRPFSPHSCLEIRRGDLSSLYFAGLQAGSTYVHSLSCSVHLHSYRLYVGFPHLVSFSIRMAHCMSEVGTFLTDSAFCHDCTSLKPD